MQWQFLTKDYLQNAMAFSFLKKPTVTTLAANEQAILLYDSYSDITLLCADSKEAGIDVLNTISKPRCLILNRPLLLNYVNEKWHFTSKHPCFQAVYRGQEKPLLGALQISAPTDAEIEIMMQTYQFADREEMEKNRARGMLFAAHVSGAFVGYIGEHPEGSMGMLHILPPFRGMGFAYELESFLINQKLKKGHVVYCHIIDDNLASYHLQQKLGLEFAKEKIFWTAYHED
jgi:ribosomal protein S18 acetylase RimI-like enzyme